MRHGVGSVCIVAPPAPFLLDPYVFPPLGALAVATSIRDSGYDVIVHDGSVEDIPTGYDYYGISITTPQFPDAVSALGKIRSMPKKSRVFAGGPHVTIDPDSCLKAGFDGVIMGDGETGLDLSIVYDCTRIEAPAKSFPTPDRSFVDIKKYKYLIDDREATSLVTSRGCPYNCAFCCKSTATNKFKMNSSDVVVDEIKHLKDVYGYKAFMFFDDLFVMNKKRLLNICERIAPWDLKWRCFVRGDVIVRNGLETVLRMKEAGCREVGIGVESGSEEILRSINKGETHEDIKQAIRMLRGADIRVKAFFIIGLPGESPETIEQTRKFLEDCPTDDVDMTIYQPYKGSYIYENKQQFDIGWDSNNLSASWYKGHPGEYHSNVWTSRMTPDDIEQAQATLEREFKSW